MKLKKLYSLMIMAGFGMVMTMFNLPESLPVTKIFIMTFSALGLYNFYAEVRE